MNIHPPINVLATALKMFLINRTNKFIQIWDLLSYQVEL